MKRFAALALALGLVLSGCAGAPAGIAAPEPAETAAPTPAPTPEPTEEPLILQTLRLGETLEAGDVTITLERAETLGAITAMKNGEGICRNAPDGYKFLVLTGSIKNTGGTEIDADNMIGQVCIDEKYTYTMEKYVVQGLLFRTILPPLGTGTLYLYAEVPLELADSFTKCSVSFGYNDGMEFKPDSLRQCGNARCVELAVDGGEDSAVTLNIFTPEELVLDDWVEHPFVSLKFTAMKTTSILRRKYKNEVFSCSTERDMKIICLEGTIKNTGEQGYRPALSGCVTVDGYIYPLRAWLVNKSGQLQPLKETPFYAFAEIPPELADSYTKAEFRFGFNDDFANNSFTNFEACRYEYVYRWEKEVKGK